MEKKDNRGGARPGAGRPRRTEEMDVIKLFDEHIDRNLVVNKLLDKIKQGDTKAITLYFQYIFGKPIAHIDQTTNLQINSVDISKMVSFGQPDLLPLPEDIEEDNDPTES
jgi:hypothetical protein